MSKIYKDNIKDIKDTEIKIEQPKEEIVFYKGDFYDILDKTDEEVLINVKANIDGTTRMIKQWFSLKAVEIFEK